MASTIKNSYCLNCEQAYPKVIPENEEHFCSNCGQSSYARKLSAFELIKDAISNILNLDNRILHTFRDLIFPAKLSRTYIKGKRKYYVNPARLFLFTLIGLITIALYLIILPEMDFGVNSIYERTEKSKMLQEFEAMMDTTDFKNHEEVIDSIKASLFQKVSALEKDTIGKNSTFISLGNSIESYGITVYDAVHLTEKEIFKKYKVEGFWNKINVGQFIRIKIDPSGAFKFAIQNVTWAVFFTILFMSLFLKLLYFRGDYHLVEHAVLILNSHSLLFVVIILNIILHYIFNKDLETPNETIRLISFLSFLAIIILQFSTLKKYYQQGIFKTLLKQFIINSAYVMIFIFMASLVAIISLILY